MKASEVYLRAAEGVDIGKYKFSCVAVSCCERKMSLADGYATTFGFSTNDADRSTKIDQQLWKMELEQSRPLRVLMLCLMSAIAADEERTLLSSARTVGGG